MKKTFLTSLLMTLCCLAAMAQATKPIVGITTGFSNSMYTLRYTYIESVKQAGGIPLILPFVNEASEAAEFVARIDALIVSGGADVDPVEYGEEPERALGGVDPDRQAHTGHLPWTPNSECGLWRLTHSRHRIGRARLHQARTEPAGQVCLAQHQDRPELTPLQPAEA